MSTLPELTAPPEYFYDDKRSREYTRNSRVTRVQSELTERALELLQPEKGSILLDLGCGSGLSSAVIAGHGHPWVGLDISRSMLSLASSVPLCLGRIEADLGRPLPFSANAFEYAVSISAVQWLLHSYKKEEIPDYRIRTFFRTLYRVISKRVVVQYYCDSKGESIFVREALSAGFSGCKVVDGLNTKNEKRFLVLEKGRMYRSVTAIGGEVELLRRAGAHCTRRGLKCCKGKL